MATNKTDNFRTQQDLVNSELRPAMLTDKLPWPGIEKLHLLDKEELAKVIVQVLRARPNVRELRYVLGDGFYLTYEPATRY